MTHTSQIIQPGQQCILLVPVREGMKPAHVWMDPPTGARFEVRSVEILTRQAMRAESGGRLDCAGVRLAACNTSAEAAPMRFEIELSPDTDAMERELARIVERDWASASDRARSSN